MMMQLDQPTAVHHISFNQDHGCFAVGLSTDFRVYNADPLRLLFSRSLDAPRATSAITHVTPLFRSNMVALVSGGSRPVYPPNKVMIWDDRVLRCIGELSFRSEVRGVRLRRDRVVVVCSQKIFVYNFSDLKLVHHFETALNPKGLCEISSKSAPMVLVCLGLRKGEIRVEDYGLKRTKFVMAHDSKIVCTAVSMDGRFVATASDKGTLIRVFNSFDGSLLQEFRRGMERAEIYSIAFSSDVRWLAVSSDKGTVHVFGLKIGSGSSMASSAIERSIHTSEQNQLNGLRIPSLSILKGVLPKYFSSEWSVAQFRLPEGFRFSAAFGHRKNTVVIIGMDGSFYRCEFDPARGGEMRQLEYHNFLDVDKLVEPPKAFKTT